MVCRTADSLPRVYDTVVDVMLRSVLACKFKHIIQRYTKQHARDEAAQLIHNNIINIGRCLWVGTGSIEP